MKFSDIQAIAELQREKGLGNCFSCGRALKKGTVMCFRADCRTHYDTLAQADRRENKTRFGLTARGGIRK